MFDDRNIGMHLTIAPEDADTFRHEDGTAEARMGRHVRLSVITAPPSPVPLITDHPVVLEARGETGTLYLELSPRVAESLGLALIRHAARTDAPPLT